MADNLVDAHTFSLDWQGNIYTVATITQYMAHTAKLIVATLNRKVFCFELSMSHCARPCGCVVVPQTQELQFTYIPSGAEIISIDAFNRSKIGDDFVIGVTIIKSAESGSPGQYLNIYSSDWDSIDCRQFELENLAQSCFSLPLEFVPYQLSHCEVEDVTVWLLGGSDKRVHIYGEDKAKHMYQEVNPSEILPEFVDGFPSVPLWTDMLVLDNTRVTATGCECGLLVVTTLKIGMPDSMKSWYKEFDGPLTCTKLFSVTPPVIDVPFCLKSNIDQSEQTTKNPLHLCVTHSLGSSEVFHDILENGLSQVTQLPQSNTHDMAVTVCMADIDLTGEHRLVLGTYGQELLVYKKVENSCDWELEWSRSLPAPVLGIRWVDMTGDGLRELVVITTKGVQVLQNQLDTVKEVTLSRLRKLIEQKRSKKSALD